MKIWSTPRGDTGSHVNYNGPKVDNAALEKSGHMLEHLENLALLRKRSENVSSADDQQERLVRIGWVTGFVEGEGCFSIGFIKQPHRERRRGYRTGYQVSHEFAVTQGARSVKSLAELLKFFGVGQILINRRYDNHKEDLFRYVVRRRGDLLTAIIPFFRRYPMRAAKQDDFEKFAACMVSRNEHKSAEGLIRIAETTQTMNHRKSRRDLIRILRDHTPDFQRSVE